MEKINCPNCSKELENVEYEITETSFGGLNFNESKCEDFETEHELNGIFCPECEEEITENLSEEKLDKLSDMILDRAKE